MELFLLIYDNADLTDSTGASEMPLKMYARADLYSFQNKDDKALQTLDSLLTIYPAETVCDRALFKKAVIKIRQEKYADADTLLGTIISKYSYSVLADDALFKKAEMNQFQFKNTQKAMNLYEKMLKDYPGSIFTIEARKRFRQLRGDQIN
jgi:TolA-binding protein